MALTQTEADQLLQMSKIFTDQFPIEFTMTQPMDYDRVLHSTDRREQFLLTIERGRRKRIRLKYQTRARRVIILARIDLNGPRHKNPPNAPYRPGQWISETHIHLYRENFEDRIAYELADAPGWGHTQMNNPVVVLEHFMQFCGIAHWPPIQTSI